MSKRPPRKASRRRPHDPVYRRIFTNPRMIEEVLRRFVAGSWIHKLDFSTLELVPARYVSRFLDERESDVVWRVRHGPDKEDWFYVYVLMELQSSVDRFMVLRLWAYLALFYESLRKQKQLTSVSLLPPVLPVVLYNGEEPWWAPRSLDLLIQEVEGLHRPSFEYVVLDASHYPVEELRPLQDVASGIFLMEQAGSVEELWTVVDEMDRLVDDPELEQDIALLLSSVIGKLAQEGHRVPGLKTLQEVRDMLQERVARWPEQWRQEGLEEGMKRGKAELLKAQASHRFGELPPDTVERFERADVDTLDRWSRRLLDARRLEDIFDDSP